MHCLVRLIFSFLSVVCVGTADGVLARLAAQEPTMISTIAQIHGVPAADLDSGIPIDMECIVLCYEPDWPILFLSDGRDGMYVGNPTDLQLKRGNRVRLLGKLGPNRWPIDCTFQPSNNQVDFPPIKYVDFNHLRAGNEDSQLVAIEAQLVGLDSERQQLSLEMRTSEGGRFRGLVSRELADEEQIKRMLGKRLRLRGVVGGRFDRAQRWIGFQIWLGDPSNIEELEQPGEAHVMPLTPIADLSADLIASTHSSFFRTAGQVNFQLSDSMILLQDADHELFVELQKPGRIQLDRAYDALGCLDTGVEPPVMRGAMLLPSAERYTATRPARIDSVETLVGGNFSGQLVRTSGTYAGPLNIKGKHGFLLSSNSSLLPVFVDGEALAPIATGTKIKAEGIWVQQKSLVGFNIGSCALHARPNGIQVGSQTPWLMITSVGIVGAFALATTTWAIALRRMVRHRTQQFLESVKEKNRTEEQYANVFIHARVMVLTTDEQGKIIAVNHAALRTTKRDSEQLLGTHVTDLVDENSKGQLQDLLRSALDSDKTVTCNVQMLDADDHVVPQEVSCWTSQHSGENHLHLIWHDISERLRVEQQRAEMEQRMLSAQKMESLGALAGGVAHDFNNLLTVIVGNTAILSMSDELSSEGRASLTSIQHASERAAELTQQMLAYAGRGRIDVGVVDLSKLVTDISQLLAVSLPKNQQLSFDLSANLPGTKADATQLRQIVMNLVRNASESMTGRGGLILLRTFLAEPPIASKHDYLGSFIKDPHALHSTGMVGLEVSDQGDGIDPTNLGKIFDPFYSTKFSGRGLGLALVLGIVRAHHGILTVNSKPGQGSTFRIFLPACADKPTLVPVPHLSKQPLGLTCHVIVVDDEPEVLNATAKTLEMAGHQVTRCLSAEEALAAIQQDRTRYQCLVTDQTMPGMSGLQLCEALNSQGFDLPIILISGYSVDLFESIQSQPNIEAFLQKPFRAADLMEQIRMAVSKRSGVAGS